MHGWRMRILAASILGLALPLAATAAEWREAGPGSWEGAPPGEAFRAVASVSGLELVTPAGSARLSWPAVLEPGSPVSRGALLEIDGPRAGASLSLTDAGLEVLCRWEGAGAPAPFLLELAAGGTLARKVVEDGRTVRLLGRRGSPALVLRDLVARGEDGRELDARWEASPGGLRLAVEGAEPSARIETSFLVAPGKAPAPAGSPDEPRGSLAPPANDQCSGAEVIPPAGPFPYATASRDITDAGTVGDPAPPGCQPDVSRSVWYAFTPPANGTYGFALCADGPTATTVPDTVLAVYSSTGTCAGLAEVAGGCDDDGCASGDLQSSVGPLTLTGGTTYYVVAWQYGTAAPAPGASTVQLLVTQPGGGSAPANDQCGGAEVIPPAGPFPHLTALIPDVSDATTLGDPPEPSCQPLVSRSVWYTFTPSVSGNYSFATCADGPTGTTLDDTVIALYDTGGACSGLVEHPGACDDDACAVEAAQAAITGVPLTAGTTYEVVVWKFDVGAPSAGQAALQLRVDRAAGPGNDRCAAAVPLALDTPAEGTTANAVDDYQLDPGGGCFTGIGQTPSAAVGADVSYRFTAPAAGKYSFRANGYDPARNLVLHVEGSCPGGTPPVTIADCLGAANRNSGNPAEEVPCLALSSGQTVYVTVDENAATAGSPFRVEVNACSGEVEPNGTPGAAAPLSCGVTGSIAPAGDADVFALGAPAAGSRLFAVVDGVAANTVDFDLRVTTASDTLEYDDANNDVPFGSTSANVAGTPLDGTASYAKVTHFSAIQQSEPYRLYAVAQPPSASATLEIEPNDAPASATAGTNLYFRGALSSSSDVDLFRFTAAAGDLVVLGLDLDPGRDATPWNGSLALLDGSGAALASVNDSGSTSSTTPGTGNLSAKTPNSPGEAIVWRIRSAGTYLARVAWSSGTAGDYLLSVSRGCAAGTDADGDGVPDAQDCAPGDGTAWSVPGPAASLAFGDKTQLSWAPPAAPGGTVVRYDLLRSTSAPDFSAPACVAADVTATQATDATVPSARFFYLVRSENACGGSLGAGSGGTPRTGGSCP